MAYLKVLQMLQWKIFSTNLGRIEIMCPIQLSVGGICRIVFVQIRLETKRIIWGYVISGSFVSLIYDLIGSTLLQKLVNLRTMI